MTRELDANKIGNRMFFGGNLLCQQSFEQLCHFWPEVLRLAASLEGSD